VVVPGELSTGVWGAGDPRQRYGLDRGCEGDHGSQLRDSLRGTFAGAGEVHGAVLLAQLTGGHYRKVAVSFSGPQGRPLKSSGQTRRRFGHGAAFADTLRWFKKPSIEVAAKISQALGVSLDYLVGNSDVLLDTELIKRITEIQQLSEADRQGIFFALDGLLRDAKARKAYA
jgi:hypothetical protein